jgi:uncharacterized glyoxalase superfamily protein PhnB
MSSLSKLTPNCMVEDVARTLDYYRDLLGFTVAATVPERPPLDWAMAVRDGVTLMFQSRTSLAGEMPLFRDLPVGGSLGFYIDVTDVRGLYEQLKGRAELVLDLRETFYGATEFAIRDCNGYVLCFAENKGEG